MSHHSDYWSIGLSVQMQELVFMSLLKHNWYRKFVSRNPDAAPFVLCTWKHRLMKIEELPCISRRLVPSTYPSSTITSHPELCGVHTKANAQMQKYLICFVITAPLREQYVWLDLSLVKFAMSSFILWIHHKIYLPTAWAVVMGSLEEAPKPTKLHVILFSREHSCPNIELVPDWHVLS